jgi:hypothetical protein
VGKARLVVACSSAEHLSRPDCPLGPILGIRPENVYWAVSRGREIDGAGGKYSGGDKGGNGMEAFDFFPRLLKC